MVDSVEQAIAQYHQEKEMTQKERDRLVRKGRVLMNTYRQEGLIINTQGEVKLRNGLRYFPGELKNFIEFDKQAGDRIYTQAWNDVKARSNGAEVDNIAVLQKELELIRLAKLSRTAK